MKKILTKMNIQWIIPLILLLLVTLGGWYYYQYHSSEDFQNSYTTQIASQEGIILGENTPTTTLADASTYNQKVLAMRQPINQGFEDISEKSKYTNLFGPEDIQKVIDETRVKIEEGIKQLENWSIAESLRTANDQHLQSLRLLLEAINAYDQSRKTTDKKESQRLKELYAYNIEQSNKILKNIQIAK